MLKVLQVRICPSLSEFIVLSPPPHTACAYNHTLSISFPALSDCAVFITHHLFTIDVALVLLLTFVWGGQLLSLLLIMTPKNTFQVIQMQSVNQMIQHISSLERTHGYHDIKCPLSSPASGLLISFLDSFHISHNCECNAWLILQINHNGGKTEWT